MSSLFAPMLPNFLANKERGNKIVKTLKKKLFLKAIVKVWFQEISKKQIKKGAELNQLARVRPDLIVCYTLIFKD